MVNKLLGANGFTKLSSNKMGLLKDTRLDLLLRVTLNKKVLTTQKPFLHWLNSLQSGYSWPLQLSKVGLLLNWMSIMPFFMVSLIRKFLWFYLLVFPAKGRVVLLEIDNKFASYKNPSMV